MVSSMLEIARENHVHRLSGTLEVLQSKFDPVGYVMVSACYRTLAACALLLESDFNTYFAYLGNAAYARLDFLRKANASADIDPRYLALSKDLGFASALAANDWALAEEISKLSRMTHSETVEYEDDFLFHYFLHSLLLDPDNKQKQQNILDRWFDVLGGAESGYYDVCASIGARDADEYPEAFESLLDSRTRQLDAYSELVSADQELLAVERGVFIDAIAVARLAERLGLESTDTYPSVPDMARKRIPAVQVGQSSWKSFT